jgi:hypothetical protein
MRFIIEKVHGRMLEQSSPTLAPQLFFLSRLTEAGLFAQEEINTTCSFANQDKACVTGPGGEQWEVYTVLADSDTFGPNTEQRDQTCCTT